MPTTLEDIDYDSALFNSFTPPRHPPYINDRQIFYHLTGPPTHLTTLRHPDTDSPIRSPRRLEQICANFVVSESSFPCIDNLPSPLYPILLTEAILFREPRPISALVSTWPETFLNVVDHVPLEDDLRNDYLTSTFEGHEDVTLLDCFVLGFLKLKSPSRLKTVDFRGFAGDRRLCKELLRLPVLWLEPNARSVEKLHPQMCDLIEISQEKVACYLNRISAVYANLDCEFKHQLPMDKVTIVTDMHINIDDVPIGLSLQHLSPFSFKASKVWVKPLSDVHFPINHLHTVLNPQHVTHLELEDTTMNTDPCKLYNLNETLSNLTNLTSLSLPSCLDVTRVPFVAKEIARHLSDLKCLSTVNFSYCDLRGHLHFILDSLQGPIRCLNLKDCRLEVADVMALLPWPPLKGLRELNLSCNNLKYLEALVRCLITEAPLLTCFSLSFCMLPITSQVSILRHCATASRLKVISLQSYIPPLRGDLLWLLESLMELPRLQKAIIFPETYAFPGDVEVERSENKLRTLSFCAQLMMRNGRGDLRIE